MQKIQSIKALVYLTTGTVLETDYITRAEILKEITAEFSENQSVNVEEMLDQQIEETLELFATVGDSLTKLSVQVKGHTIYVNVTYITHIEVRIKRA